MLGTALASVAGPVNAASATIANNGVYTNSVAVTGTSGLPAVHTLNTDDALSITNNVGASITGVGASAITIGYAASDTNPPVSGANLGTFVNNGTISAANTSWASALKVGGTVGNFTNTGTMTALRYDTVLIMDGVTGTFLNDTDGVITAATDGTVSINGTTNNFTNRGTITQTSDDSDQAVFIRELEGVFDNSGIIQANGGTAVDIRDGYDGDGVTVINSGTIRSTSGNAITLTDEDDLLTLMTGSTTLGDVDGGDGDDRLTVDGSGNSSFAINQLELFEEIEKLGTGTWTFTGDNAADMVADIEAGLLAVNGNMSATDVTVRSGATLGGTGRLGITTVATGGSVAPGNSVGTLRTGDVDFASGSALDIELAGNSADRLRVDGSVTVGANVAVNVTGTAASCGTISHAIITTTGGIDQPGNFTLNTLLSNASLSYEDNDLFLNIDNGIGRTFSGFTDTKNQAATAKALDDLGCGNQPYAAQLNALSDDEVPDAMDALSGEGHATVAAMMIEQANGASNAMAGRLDQAFDKIVAAGSSSAFFGHSLLSPQTMEELDIWGFSYGGLLTKDSDGNAAAAQSAQGGLMVGADTMLNEQWRAGLVAGAGFTGIEAGPLSAASFDAMFGAYAGAEIGVVRIKAGAAYTRHFISTSRSIVFPGVSDTMVAAYQAGTTQGFVEISTDIDLGDVTLVPFGKLDGVLHATDGFTETGGAGALTTDASMATALFTTIGIGAEHDFVLSDTMLVTARGSLAWRHAFAGQVDVANAFAGGGPFTVASAGIGGDVLLVSIGATIDIDDRTSLDLGYDAALGSGVGSHAVKLTLSGKL